MEEKKKKRVLGVHLRAGGKKRVYGIAQAGGKFHAGDLSDIPEVQEMVGTFYEKRGDRTNVVMVRLADDALARIDELIEAGLVSSRSEAAASLIEAGIDSRKTLFDGLTSTTQKIRKLKQELRQKAMDSLNLKQDGGAR